MEEQEQGRQQDGTERVDVLEGIEADSAKQPGCVVAQRCATKPWAASCRVIARSTGITQVDAV